MSDNYCPTCDPVLRSMSRIITAREHDAKVAWGMINERDAKIECLLEGQELLRQQTVRIRQAATGGEPVGDVDTETLVKALRWELKRLHDIISRTRDWVDYDSVADRILQEAEHPGQGSWSE